MRKLWLQIKRRRWTIAALLAGVAIAALIFTQASSDDEGELSTVELASPHLLDDGAGQRYYEISYPKRKPRATLLLIHASGWSSQGPAAYDQARHAVNQATDAGFRVVAISADQSPALDDPAVRPNGGRVLDDVLAFHDQIRDAFPDEPLCASGTSGGGHLALLLAIERPGIDCVTANGPPTDLVALTREAQVTRSNGLQQCASPDQPFEFGACLALLTWGDSTSDLRRASPALRWNAAIETPVWAGFERQDPIIPSSQRRSLARAIDDLELIVLEPDPKGPAFAHSTVSQEDFRRAGASRERWLDEVVPPVRDPQVLPDEDLSDGIHLACNSRLEQGASWREGRRRDRSNLLTAPGRWQSSTSMRLGVANSCDGREDLQIAGLQAWSPGFGGRGRYVERGSSAEWTFEAPAGSQITGHTASIRGFIANPGVWEIGLYSRGPDDEKWQSVATCDGARCSSLEAEPVPGGTAIVPAGTGANPDQRRSLPAQRWELADKTTELLWKIECIAARGCVPRSINPDADPAGNPTRRIDPSGRPAVLSLYELEVEVAES